MLRLLFLLLFTYSIFPIHCETKNCTRIEGVYNVAGSLKGQSLEERYTDEGIVVYYLNVKKNGEIECKKHMYPFSESTKRTNPITDSFWPYPILTPNNEFDSVKCGGDTLVLNRRYRISDNNNSIKALRVIGLGLEISEWCTRESFLHDISPETLITINSRIAYTVKGKNFKRIYGTVPVECNDTITVTITKIDCLASDKVKRKQKEDIERFSKKVRSGVQD